MKNTEKGQSLFELVVAIAISALIIVAIVSLVTNAIKSATFSKNRAIATSLASETIEWLRSERDNNIQGFIDHSEVPIYCFTQLNWEAPGSCTASNAINNLFSREGDFSISTPSGKTQISVIINVTWADSQGAHTVSNNTVFTDWRQR